MGNTQKPSGLNKFLEQSLVVTGSKTARIILLIFVICGGLLTIYTEINRVFPIDVDEIHGLIVQTEWNKPADQRFLIGNDLNKVVQSINDLKLVQKQNLSHISLRELEEARYSIRIIYETENSFRSNHVVLLHFMEECKVLVEYGGYTQYQIVEPHYDDFLSILDEMATKYKINEE